MSTVGEAVHVCGEYVCGNCYLLLNTAVNLIFFKKSMKTHTLTSKTAADERHVRWLKYCRNQEAGVRGKWVIGPLPSSRSFLRPT
jgi:hypothetical protein